VFVFEDKVFVFEDKVMAIYMFCAWMNMDLKGRESDF
jgi:hypothetical protein